MMSILLNYLPFPYVIIVSIAAVVFAAMGMEAVAWSLHKYVMHQFGWVLHEDHHRPSKSRFQKNDMYAIFFAILSIILIIIGIRIYGLLFWLGIGVTLYGIGYVVFHDILFHKRIKNNYHPKKGYMKRIFNAHTYHHVTTNKKGSHGQAYGFIYASKKYTPLLQDLLAKKNK
ncbi:MAG: conserved membrane protein of unknown function [Promethearchaeota archaeon]|nr:MAG: conserved membrane protein of unknown function [Candidatus Lokiarchaeota archaeon]